MSRARRMHAPGCAFHVTVRTQGRVALFNVELRERIADYICGAAANSTTQLLAYTVMPNHLHMIVRQGSQPLGWMVQRVLQRTALLVRRAHGHRDHVFGRRYWSGLCHDPAYLRQAIIYTHLNANYAGLCKDPADYPWSSHRAYAGLPITNQQHAGHVRADHGLALFAAQPLDIASPRPNYMRFIRYWMERPRLPLGARYLFTSEEIATAPRAGTGDQFWASEYGDAVSSVAAPSSPAMDVRDRALVVLRRLAPDLTLELVRAGGRVQAINTVRRELTAALLPMGCRNGAIARCLNVSPSYVSAVAAEIRAKLNGSRGQTNSDNGRS